MARATAADHPFIVFRADGSRLYHYSFVFFKRCFISRQEGRSGVQWGGGLQIGFGEGEYFFWLG